MSAIQMTPAQLKRAKKLIRAECCNYDAQNNECFALDEGDGCVCVQSISYSLLCRWFKEAVLPLDPMLESETLRLENQKICPRCHNPFVPGSNRQEYCQDCYKKLRRERKAEHERKRRARVDR